VYCNSSEIYNLLLKDNLTQGRGEIIFDFLNISIKINQKSAIINIRPISWYSKKSKFKSFSCRREFVEALFQTLKQYPKTKENSHDWLDIIKNNYFEHTGKEL
jgi:transposase-like protein